jgi:hypothetical protein
LTRSYNPNRLPGWFGLFPVRSPLLGELFLFLWVLRCFSSPGSRPSAYVFSGGHHRFAVMGFPIRISPDRRLYTAPRGFSQCPTSFIGAWRQGIHRKPFVASLRDAENSKFFAQIVRLRAGPSSCSFLGPSGLHRTITLRVIRFVREMGISRTAHIIRLVRCCDRTQVFDSALTTEK